MTTISYQNFHKGFLTIKEDCKDYRLGQHFINCFIKDGISNEDLTCLWNKTGDEAFIQICKIIDNYQWDWNSLPLLNRGA